MKNRGALILAIGGTLAALVGSCGVEYAAWAARIMLAANLAVIVCSTLRRRSRGWHESADTQPHSLRPAAWHPRCASGD